MNAGEEFRAYMKAVNSTAGNDHHLSFARMIAFCRGEMSATEHEAAESHLVGCGQCVALFRSARDFLEPASAAEKVTAEETDEAWQALLTRVQIDPSTSLPSSETTVVPGDFQRREKKTHSRIAFALAACLLISFAILGWQTWRLLGERESRRQSQAATSQLEGKQRELEQRLAQLEQSGADEAKREREQRLAAEAERDRLQDQLAAAQGAPEIPVVYLTLSSERGPEEEIPLNLKTTARTNRLRLLISKPYEFPEYTIELIDQTGKINRVISGLRPAGNDGALSFRINRATLTTGKYRLRLFGGETRRQLGEYRLAVTAGR